MTYRTSKIWKSVSITSVLSLSLFGLGSCKTDSVSLASTASGAGSATNGDTGISSTPIGSLPSLPAGYSYNNMFMLTGPAPSTATPHPPVFHNAVLHASASISNSGVPTVNADWSQPCQINPANGNTELFCIYEIEEADLYLSGDQCYLGGVVSGSSSCGSKPDDRVWMTYNIPSSAACPYYTFEPYYYWHNEVGIGPSQVIENVDNVHGTVGYVDQFHDGINATVSTINGACLNAAKTVALNNPSATPPVNCCGGTYTLTTNTTSENSAGTGTVTTTTVVTGISWGGGNLSSCLSGPGATPEIFGARSPNLGNVGSDFPIPVVVNTSLLPASDFPLSTTFAFGGGNSVGQGGNFFSGNYFDIPAGVNVATTYFSDMKNPPVAAGAYPAGSYYPFGLSGPVPYFLGDTNPFYKVQCLDHAGDPISSIYLMIRPWSADSEFAQGPGAGYASWAASGLTPPTAAPFGQDLQFPAWGPGDLTIFPGN